MPEECTICGCTDDDCTGCFIRTGQPCHWAAPGICSACAQEPPPSGFTIRSTGLYIPSSHSG